MRHFRFRYLVVAFICWIPIVQGFGQERGNLKMKWIFPSEDTLKLDTLSIIPGTVSFYPTPENQFFFDPLKGELFWNSDISDSILAVYRTFKYDLFADYLHKDTLLINPEFSFDKEDYSVTYKDKDTPKEIISLNSLQKSGNISRGILVGNTRNLSVNSNLNLQLSGKISENIEILASITDNNIPIQPDGNTQQIQDFDKIFIQLFNDRFKLIAGDYQLISPRESYFTKYFKKNLGLSFETNFDVKNKGKMKVNSAVALSKGKFSRNQIQGQESLQGPYQLIGALNEPFIVVLSGTERVFIDGLILERGSDRDYVIDYNTAQITFTPNIIITKDKRITVEFQYSDKNYFRSLIQAGTEYKGEKFDAFINIYSEQDSKNQEQQQILTLEDKDVLANAGNDLNKAVVPSIVNTGYDANRVMYAMIDSLGYDSVFLVSTNPQVAVFQLRFSVVPPNIGDYNQGEFTANGRTFIWIAPDTTLNGEIIHRGSFAAIRKLVAPNSHQLISAGARFHPDKTLEISAELAFSHFDPNTFSSIDNEENQSGAGKVNAKKTIDLSNIKSGLAIAIFGSLEYVNKRFSPIERFRTVEFTRNWNLKEVNDSVNQLGWEAGVSFYKTNLYRLGYAYRSFDEGNIYRGGKQIMNLMYSPKFMDFTYDGSYLNTNLRSEATTFYRHFSKLKFNLKPFIIGIEDEFENNLKNISDSLLFTSYRFNDWKAFLESPDKSINKWKLFAGQRIDWKPNSELVKVNEALNLGAEYHYLKSKVHRINLTATYRKLTTVDTSGIGLIKKPENNILGRVEYILHAAKGAINWNTFYQLGSGQDQKREFFYAEVTQGLGVYEWIDLNNDGVKDLNEFFISPNPALANYIRVFTPNNNFVKVFNVQLSQNLALNPSIAWQKQQGIKGIIARFSTQTFYSINKSTKSDQSNNAFNPFVNPSLDSALQSFQNTFRNTVFFNRSFTKISVEYTYRNNRIKSLLLNGFQTKGSISNFLNIRWNITRKYSILLSGEIGHEFNASDFLSEGNFRIPFKKITPEFRYQPNQYFRVGLAGDFTKKNNDSSELEQKATIYGLSLDSRFNLPSKGSFFANVRFSNIDYIGPNNTPSQVEMLETLRPGLNLTWSVNWQQNLNKFLQLTLNYNGRKSEEISAIHVGGIEIRAFF